RHVVKKVLTPLDRLRAICLSLPEVTERLSHGAPTWFVRGKTTFVTYWEDGHHANHFPHLWCAAPPRVQQELVETEPHPVFPAAVCGGRRLAGRTAGGPRRLERDRDHLRRGLPCGRPQGARGDARRRAPRLAGGCHGRRQAHPR